eukprot:gene665-737_t
MCVGNTAPLSLFASGRTTGVVVECGAGLTSTVPVFEGLALTHASITTEDLDNPARTISSWGLVEQTFQTIKLCDDSARRDLCQNVILSGGTSMLPGLGDRLLTDLQAQLLDMDNRFGVPGVSSGGYYGSSADLRVLPHSTCREPGYTTQRKIAAWIGGSIVASLSTYKQFKITRQEWEENAESCIQTKSL